MSESVQRTGDVQFIDISESYPLSKDITVRYKTSSESSVAHSSRDWIALFRVGWTSSKDYVLYVWAAPFSNKEDEAGHVVFPASSLPTESEHFYQFCYVTRDSALRGASPPFRFTAAQACEVIEEVVPAGGGEMESMVVVRLKESKEDARSISCPKEAETDLVSFSPPKDCVKPEEKLSIFETSMFDSSVQSANAQSGTCTVQGSEKLSVTEPCSRDSDASHVHLRQSPAEVLDRRCHDLEVELDKERTMVRELTNQLQESRVTIGELGQQQERQSALHHSLLEEERAKVRYLSAQQDESRAKMVELVEELGEAKREAEELKLAVETLRTRLTEAEKQLMVKQSELEEVKMEVMYNQQNISELVGALKVKGGAGHAHQHHRDGHTPATTSPGNTTQSCPVCGQVFPGSQSPQVLEQHVQSHFND
eukprot:Em0014g373a